MLKRKLPIGIQNLSEIISEDYYYVDKTPFIAQLADQGKYYFLSRPRRFGKSLLLDTIKELFEGNRPLFKGLFIDEQWNWQKKYPVIRISFGSGILKTREELDEKINELLSNNATRFNITLTNTTISGQFKELIEKAQQASTAPVVLLIDEYDKPILDNITNIHIAAEMREGLKNLYSVIKDADAFLKFCILTGVSKFSKVSLFSGLNNLNDISMDAEYSAICGYRDEDIDQIFAPELIGLDRDDIRRWYNGYNWCGDSVYNPFDVLLLFQKREFKPYWFETATPTFLIDLLREREVFTPDLFKVQSDSELLSHFAALGVHIVVEDSSKNGKVGMMLEFNNTIYIFEFKVVEDQATGNALKQIKEKHYAEKYQAKQYPIYLVGIEFSKQQQQIIGFETEMYV